MWHLFQIGALVATMQTRVYSASCTPGIEWTFTLGDQVPPWPAKDDAPSLTPRAATQAARAFVRRTSCADADGWDVLQINLRRIEAVPDAWMYIVTFRPKFELPSGSQAGARLGYLIDVPVLLSGVVPKVSAKPAASRR